MLRSSGGVIRELRAAGGKPAACNKGCAWPLAMQTLRHGSREALKTAGFRVYCSHKLNRRVTRRPLLQDDFQLDQ